jgi:hypothetical protein
VPSKRKKVEMNLNLRFIKIEAIWYAKIKAGKLKVKLVDKEASK